MTAQVEEVERLVRRGHHVENGVHAIANLHVGFLLEAITEYFQARWIVFQFVNEVKNNPVSSTCADDVCKTEDPGLEAERADPAADETLSGLLGSTVQGDGHAGAVIFWSWHGCVLTVNHRTGGEGNFLDAGQAHGFNNVVGRHGPLVQIGVRYPGPKTDIRVRRKMIHAVDVHGHGLFYIVERTEITVHKDGVPRIQMLLDEGQISA